MITIAAAVVALLVGGGLYLSGAFTTDDILEENGTKMEILKIWENINLIFLMGGGEEILIQEILQGGGIPLKWYGEQRSDKDCAEKRVQIFFCPANSEL